MSLWRFGSEDWFDSWELLQNLYWVFRFDLGLWTPIVLICVSECYTHCYIRSAEDGVRVFGGSCYYHLPFITSWIGTFQTRVRDRDGEEQREDLVYKFQKLGTKGLDMYSCLVTQGRQIVLVVLGSSLLRCSSGVLTSRSIIIISVVCVLFCRIFYVGGRSSWNGS